MDYHCAFRIIKDAVHHADINPVIVSEGANTMDFGRMILPVRTPRSRLDAGNAREEMCGALLLCRLPF